MQAQLVAGDTLSYTRSLTDYPAGDGWVLYLRLLPRTGGWAARDVTGTASGDDHIIEATAAVTAEWPAGAYSWVEWVVLGDVSYTVAQGTCTIAKNPRTASSPLDLRTEARVALDNVRAMIRGTATQGVKRYRIAGRELERYSIEELLALESKLAADVRREEDAEAMNAGRPNPRKVHVRLGRA